MHFANPPSWWLGTLVAAAIAATAYLSYRRPLAPLSKMERATLTTLRAIALSLVALFLMRPIVLAPPASASGTVVPVLVDVSRSMRIEDADGRARIAQAADLVARQIVPALSGKFTTEIYGVGDSSAPATPDALAATARQSDLSRAIEGIREKYRGRPLAGIIVVSDGGDTSTAPEVVEGPPVFAVGVGSPEGVKDREILGITAGDPRLDQTSVDLHVSVVSVRLRQNAVRRCACSRTASCSKAGRSCLPPTVRRSKGVHGFAGPARTRPCSPRRSPTEPDEVDCREQHAQRAGQPGGPEATSARARGGAGLRAQLSDAGAGARPGLEIGLRGSQGQEREAARAPFSCRRARVAPRL